MTAYKKRGKVKNLDTTIGLNLSYYRRLAGVSQEQLGESVGISFQQIQKYKKGINRIAASTLIVFANILDVSIDQFYGEEYKYIACNRRAQAKKNLIKTIMNPPDKEIDRFVIA